MNWCVLRARERPRLFCSCCGLPIGEGERYYELPDGLTVCAESDCLEDWAGPYLRRRPAELNEEDWER